MLNYSAEKMKFSIKDFFSKCDQTEEIFNNLLMPLLKLVLEWLCNISINTFFNINQYFTLYPLKTAFTYFTNIPATPQNWRFFNVFRGLYINETLVEKGLKLAIINKPRWFLRIFTVFCRWFVVSKRWGKTFRNLCFNSLG